MLIFFSYFPACLPLTDRYQFSVSIHLLLLDEGNTAIDKANISNLSPKLKIRAASKFFAGHAALRACTRGRPAGRARARTWARAARAALAYSMY